MLAVAVQTLRSKIRFLKVKEAFKVFNKLNIIGPSSFNLTKPIPLIQTKIVLMH